MRLCIKCNQDKGVLDFEHGRNVCRLCRRNQKRERVRLRSMRTDISIPDSQLCSICKEIQPKASFWQTPNEINGLYYACIECHKRRVAEFRRERKAGYKEIAIPETVRCARCGEVRAGSMFSRNRATKSGVNAYCKPCTQTSDASKYDARRAKDVISHKLRVMLNAARHRARKFGVPIDIDMAYLTETFGHVRECEAIGIKIDWTNQVTTPSSPSLDRMTPALGYVRGNLELVSHKANTMKSDATVDMLQNFAVWLQQVPQFGIRTAYEIAITYVNPTPTPIPPAVAAIARNYVE